MESVMMRNAKRIISVGLVLALLATMLYVVPRNEKMDVSYAAENNGTRVRGTVNELSELPQYGRADYQSIPRGTVDRPFVVLEIVPYEEYAEFGYLIGGCEPIDTRYMHADEAYHGNVGVLNVYEVARSPYWDGYEMPIYNNVCFFTDEPEGDVSLYKTTDINGAGARTDGYYYIYGEKTVNGYYELVEEGRGNFRYTITPVETEPPQTEPPVETEGPSVSSGDLSGPSVSDGDSEIDGDGGDGGGDTGDGGEDGGDETDPETEWDVTIEKCQAGESGNLIWHTVNDFENYSGVTFEEYTPEVLSAHPLENTGDRLYTKRTSKNGENDIININRYFVYNNSENFLKVSMGLSDEQTENYSIVVKTITPEALNQSPDWIEYSDLIVLSPKSHNGSLAKLWAVMHGRTADSVHTEQGFNGSNDFTWDVALRLYNKITATSNYAGIIIDDGVYNSAVLDGAVTGKIFDYNLRPSGMTQNIRGSASNVYKLCVMLLSMDSSLFKSLYLSGENPLIQNGVFRLRQDEGTLADHWGFGTFYLSEPGSSMPPEQYWDNATQWNNYNTWANVTSEKYKYWCNEHVFTYKGDNSISMDYNTNNLGQYNPNYADLFKDFSSSLTEAERGAAHSSLAVRYILNAANNPENQNYGQGQTIRILDLEPSVGLMSSGSPDWYLTESYVHMLLPHYVGNIQITHQTTAEFIGKIEDLNITYDMVFMGLDCSAYNLGADNRPDWNDDSLDGKIYLRTGDKMTAAELIWRNNNRSVKWLSGGADSAELRFPGNDISSLKKADLVDFLLPGYPIVAETPLYNLDTSRIDPSTYIYSFINTYKEYGNLNSVSMVEQIEKNVKNTLGSAVTFDSMPPQYNGQTASEDSPIVTSPNYLTGHSLDFAFTVTPRDGEHYKFRLYVDQDKDSKFSDEEIIHTRDAVSGRNTDSYRISSAWIGLVQWKLEVFQVDSSGAENGIRYSQTGRSAVRNTGEKKTIRVLQIMPNSGCNLDLSTDERFMKYYTQLQDYVIQMDAMTWDEFEKFFYTETVNADGSVTKTSKGFSYNYTEPISEDGASLNPVNLNELDSRLSDYNMLIMGFGDTYGGTNLSNKYGAIDYLRYYVDQGKSILFTHDLTSMHNTDSSNYGYTVNTLMRDLMGMNRYKSMNKNINSSGNESNPVSESQMLSTYQAANADKYDTMNSGSIQGYTYYAMKRLGYTDGDNAGLGCKMPYKYMIVNPLGQDYFSNTPRHGTGTGFNNNNDETTKVSMLNEGQVTMYPYFVGDSLTVASTHAQWYGLSPEDPNVTVWYCLAGDSDSSNGNNNIFASAGNKGISTTYAVSPNDAMNNYYIYSKGNIFYSGVGHSTVTGEMETKLFINTMIAAYSASYVPPTVEVTNTEAYMKGIQNYAIELLQTYDFATDDDGNIVQNVEDFAGEGETYPVNFTPLDSNLITTTFKCKIYYDNGENGIVYVDNVVELNGENGDPVMVGGHEKVISAGADHVFTNLENGKYYRLYYPKEYIEYVKHDVCFNIENEKHLSSTTILNMEVMPLFPLD